MLPISTGRRVSLPKIASSVRMMALSTSEKPKASEMRVSAVCAVKRTPATRDSHQMATDTNTCRSCTCNSFAVFARPVAAAFSP